MHKIGLAFLSLSLCAAVSLSALEFSFGTTATVRTDAAADTSASKNDFVEATAGVSYDSEGFRMVWDLGFSTEREYPADFLGGFDTGFSIDILEAGMSYMGGPFTLSLGKLENKDVVDSPYALFISGADRKAMLGSIKFEDDHFFFEDRWIGLNHNLKSGIYNSEDTASVYEDRGAVLKTYGLKFGRLRLGFEDAVVFTGEYFNPDFFANPAPTFYVQYVAKAAGRPWTRSGDQNAIMGFFGDYRADNWSAYAQLLVDDFNLNRFINPSSYQNPDKLAFSAGGTWDSPIGKLGIYAAGATRYTFESIGSSFYSYTYYPASAVISDGEYIGIPLSEAMLGYVHGENNLSTMATWGRALSPKFGLGASLELSLTGEQSPANPWHNMANFDYTRWLDDSVLEKKVVLGGGASYRIGAFLLSASGKIGWVQNRLSLVTVTDDGDGSAEPIWEPSSYSGLIGELTIGVQYTFGL